MQITKFEYVIQMVSIQWVGEIMVMQQLFSFKLFNRILHIDTSIRLACKNRKQFLTQLKIFKHLIIWSISLVELGPWANSIGGCICTCGDDFDFEMGIIENWDSDIIKINWKIFSVFQQYLNHFVQRCANLKLSRF